MDSKTPQRIARLTPLADVLARVTALAGPVAPREAAPHEAVGRALAADAFAGETLPAQALALHDGWAIASDATLDATSYAPAPLPALPGRIDTGEAMPAGADAVASLDAVNVRGGEAEALANIAPGESVLPAGADAARGAILRRAGERIDLRTAAVLAAAGIARVRIREPRIRIVSTRSGRFAEVIADFIAGAAMRDGGKIVAVEMAADSDCLAGALQRADADAIVAIGGTGTGRADASVQILARIGRVETHGVAIAPGETAGFGMMGMRPVLLVPGRFDAALAVWLLLGRPLLVRLAAARAIGRGATATLSRKVSSHLGLTELVPVRGRQGVVEPLATGYLPLHALAGADGWIVVPPGSEGYPAGASVEVHVWP